MSMTTINDSSILALPVATTRYRALSTGAVALRVAELVVLYLGVPALLWLEVIPLRWFWGVIGAAAAYACAVLAFDRSFRWRTLWRWPAARPQLRRIFFLWAIGLVVMVAFTLGVDWHLIPLDTRQPHPLFFTLPLYNPLFWCAIMVLYPIFSVLPQEFVYRVFFFHRYERMLGSRWLTILFSALLFGWAHILFQNWIAVSLSAVLGLLLAITFARSRSGAAAWLEHALYGDAAFTIGLGWFFFTGAVHP